MSGIDAAVVLWCAGTQARPAAILAWRGRGNGAVKVTENCSVPGHANIFAIGDVASFDPGTAKPLPGLAPVAKQQGKYVGRPITDRIAGREKVVPFTSRS